MSGLKKLCKMYGQIDCVDKDGKKVVWLWDYAKDEPRLKSEMTKEEIKESEKTKWLNIKNSIK